MKAKASILAVALQGAEQCPELCSEPGLREGTPTPPWAVNLWRKKILCQCIVWPKVVRKSAGGEARGDTEKTMEGES